MSAGLDINVFDNQDLETNVCAVVSIYEDVGARDLLFHLCDFLVSKFKDDVDFQLDWWRFKYLADPIMAMEAAQKAAQADLILLATQSSELPYGVRKWFESWLSKRKSTDGALVLVQSSPESISQTHSLASYLRTTAKRAQLDYFRLNSTDSTPVPSNPDLAELLTYDDRPVHWGINE